jgi:hypothetical protein
MMKQKSVLCIICNFGNWIAVRHISTIGIKSSMDERYVVIGYIENGE